MSILVCFLAYQLIQQIPIVFDRIALSGFSPLSWMQTKQFPENYVNGYPSGVEIFSKSSFSIIYTIAAALGQTPTVTVQWITAVDYLLLTISLFLLVHALRLDSNPIVPFLVILYASSTSLRSINIAGYAQPFFSGQFYNVVDALRFLTIASMLTGRNCTAILIVAMIFTIHPTQGLTTSIILLAMRYGAGRPGAREVAAIFVSLAIAGWWIATQFEANNLLQIAVPADAWFRFTQIFSCHFYPLRNLTGTTCAVLLICILFRGMQIFWRNIRYSELDRTVRRGCIAILSMVLLGIAISAVPISPALIKISLHRSSDLLIVLALAYSIAVLLHEFDQTTKLKEPLKISLLVLPLALPYLYGVWFKPSQIDVRTILGLTLLLVVIPLVFVIFLNRQAKSFRMRALACILVSIATLVPPVGALSSAQIRLSRAVQQLAGWAQVNSNPGSVFFIDPTMGSGFRDLANRAEAGNIREWLYHWAYTNNGLMYQEGIRRASLLGVPVDEMIKATDSPPYACLDGRSFLGNISWIYDSNEGKLCNLMNELKADFLVTRGALNNSQRTLVHVYSNDIFDVYRNSCL
ncbi:MAG: hypothetical protein QY326_01930 [Bdellovibrionota bacterium]|nr:MAG: hypothetical protein QY326_01930 [Bdellovibrionota bacterium]